MRGKNIVRTRFRLKSSAFIYLNMWEQAAGLSATMWYKEINALAEGLAGEKQTNKEYIFLHLIQSSYCEIGRIDTITNTKFVGTNYRWILLTVQV